MKAVRAVKLPHFVIEEILFILKSFRTADILYEEMSERCRDEIAIGRAQLNLGLRGVVDCENEGVIVATAAACTRRRELWWCRKEVNLEKIS